jgi:hypothetical protein
MSKKKKPVGLEAFDAKYLTEILQVMLRKLIEDPHTEKEVTVTVKMPKAIIDGFQSLEQLGFNSNTMLGEMASDGIRHLLQELIAAGELIEAEEDNKKSPLDLKKMGIDLSGLENPLTNIQKMMQDLQGLQSQFDITGVTNGSNPKNSK